MIDVMEGEIESTTREAYLPLWIQVGSNLAPKYGGISSALSQLARSLHDGGRCRTSIASFAAAGDEAMSSELESNDVRFWPLDRSSWLNRQRRLEFRASLEHATGVHIHGLWDQSSMMASAGAKALRIPYMVSAHGMLDTWALGNRRWKKKAYAALIERSVLSGARCLHALTSAEVANYRAFGMKQPIVVIPNGVTIPSVRRPELFLNRYPELQGKRLVLSLSRLHIKKGIHLLLEAWAATTKFDTDAHLVLAGPDSDGMLASLQQGARRLGITDRITFTGMLDRDMKWSALASAACFVLPSQSEGLSMALLEAIGIGLPVIVSRQANMPQVKRHHLGWEIEPTVGELTIALADFFSTSDVELAHMGMRGSRLVAEKYSWPHVATCMAEAYAWVAGGPKPKHCEVVYES